MNYAVIKLVLVVVDQIETSIVFLTTRNIVKHACYLKSRSKIYACLML